MTKWRRKQGQDGEQIAAAFLQRQGYRIEERNYRIRQGEIDIIAWDGSTLVFVEVKTKTQSRFGSPEEMVDRRKQQTMTRVAMVYVQQRRLEHTTLRFDVVAVRVGPDATPYVTHVPEAFSPTTDYFY